jgi:hypothetical protein
VGAVPPENSVRIDIISLRVFFSKSQYFLKEPILMRSLGDYRSDGSKQVYRETALRHLRPLQPDPIPQNHALSHQPGEPSTSLMSASAVSLGTHRSPHSGEPLIDLALPIVPATYFYSQSCRHGMSLTGQT